MTKRQFSIHLERLKREALEESHAELLAVAQAALGHIEEFDTTIVARKLIVDKVRVAIERGRGF